MSNLSDYIRTVKEYKENNPNITELELVRYVYLQLGQKFNFDTDFIPFGNSKKRQAIYRKHKYGNVLDECMENNTIICVSLANIMEYVLKAVDVNIVTIRAEGDERKYPHVYNLIKPKNGGIEYTIDLQDDLKNIQSHSYTRSFGLTTLMKNTPAIPRSVIEKIDRKLGYIDNENYYSDDYLYLIKSDIGYFENFDEKVKFLLENIDIFENPNIKYAERQWHHADILEQFFNDEEFNYMLNNRKIRMIDCYKDINGKRNYYNFISVQTKQGTEMYVYNEKLYKYKQLKLKDFARAVKNGLVIHNCSVPGLGRELKKIKEEEEK